MALREICGGDIPVPVNESTKMADSDIPTTNCRLFFKGFTLNVLVTLFVWGSLFEAFSVSQAQPNEGLKSQFLQEAPKKWEEYRALSKRLQGERTDNLTGPHGSERKVKHHIKQNPSSALLIQDYSVNTAGTTPKPRAVQWKKVFVSNSQYAFALQWKVNGWILTDLELGRNKTVKTRGEPVEKEICKLVSPHFFFDTTSLDEVIKDPLFTVKGVSQDGPEKKNIAVQFDYTIKPKDAKVTIRFTGWMRLNPASFWHLINMEARYEVDGTFLETMRWENTVAGKENDLPIIKRSTFQSNPVNGKKELIREGVFEFDLEDRRNVPDREFTLAAFGLSEPHGIIWKSESSSYLWFIASGVFALFLGLFFYRRFHRNNALKGRVAISSFEKKKLP